MKLSPEAKQAIKTAIEQLRLLLVDDAMDTVREEVSKQWMDDGKGDCSCQIKHTEKCGSNRQVVLEVPELEVSDNQAEKRPDNEAPEVERIVSAIIRNAAASELLRQLS